MLPDRVSNPGPLTYESDALPTALRGPVSSGTSASQGEQLCHIIYESMHPCTSFGPDKLKL